MICDFQPFGIQNSSDPASYRKHQSPSAPALPTDIANGWPDGGFSGARPRGNVSIPTFYAQIGEQRWGGGGRLLPGANSTAAQEPGTGEIAGPQIANVTVAGGKAPTRTFRPMFVIPEKSKRGSAHAFHGSGAYGDSLDVPPDIVPGNAAFDHGVVVEKQESPSCAGAAEAGASTPEQAIQAAAKAPESVHKVSMMPVRKSGPGNMLKKLIQRPSRAGRKQSQVTERVFNFRTGGFQNFRYLK